MKTVLEWEVMSPANRPPTTACLFSDGVQFRVGWWSNDEGKIYVPRGDGTNEILKSIFTPRWWAKLENLHWESEFPGVSPQDKRRM